MSVAPAGGDKGSASRIKTDARGDYAQGRRYALIEPCPHPGGKYTVINGSQHRVSAPRNTHRTRLREISRA